MTNTIIIIGGIVSAICLWILVRRLNVHREPWDDIQDIGTQEDLNNMRLKYGLNPKKINYKTGAIAK